MARKRGKGKNRENKLVFRIITPRNLITATDIKDKIDELLSVEVIDFKTGKKLGTFKLSTAKLKFSLDARNVDKK